MIINFEQYLVESGFSRLRRIMLGDVPHVNQFAILTAQNPMAKETPDKENKKRNKDLMRDLRTASFDPVTVKKGKEQTFGPSSIKGKFFGIEEDSFFIPHMDKELALYYGKKYEQEAVIWASKHEDKNDNPYFKFEYIDVASGNTDSTRIVSVANKDVQARPDMFSQVGGYPAERKNLKPGRTDAYGGEGGRKFVVPFFKDEGGYSHYIPGKKIGTITPSDNSNLSPEEAEEALARYYRHDRKIEFYIPFVDEVINGIMPLVEYAYPEYTFLSSDLPNTPEVKKLVKEIRERAEVLNESKRNQKSKYHHRSIMGVRLEELKHALEGYKRNISVNK